MNFEYGAKLYKNLSTVLRITFALLLTPDIPLVVLQLLRALLALCEVVMPVIAVVLLVAVTHATVTPWLTHLLRCGLVARGEARAHQGSFPPARSLVLWNTIKYDSSQHRIITTHPVVNRTCPILPVSMSIVLDTASLDTKPSKDK